MYVKVNTKGLRYPGVAQGLPDGAKTREFPDCINKQSRKFYNVPRQCATIIAHHFACVGCSIKLSSLSLVPKVHGMEAPPDQSEALFFEE